MPDPLTSMGRPPARPFPWFCPRCRQKEVRRATIPYQCQRAYKEQPITVVICELAVPKCGNCGELVFDYFAEEQINEAYRTQISSLNNGPNGPNGASRTVEEQAGEKQEHT